MSPLGSSSAMRLRCYAPQFVSCAFHRLRDQGFCDKRQLLGQKLGFVDVVMRWHAAVFAAELAGLGLAPPKSYRHLIERKLQSPSLGDWSRAVKALGQTLSEVAPERLVVPELVDPFRDTSGDPLRLDELLRGFVETRNERVGHRVGIQIPPEADAAAILEEQRAAFQRLCFQVGHSANRPLLVVPKIWVKRRRHYLQVLQFSGRDGTKLPEMSLTSAPSVDQLVPFLLSRDGRALLLHPWVVIQQAPSTGLHQAMLWHHWDPDQRSLQYSDVSGSNQCVPFRALDESGPETLSSLVGRPDTPAKPSMLIELSPEHTRIEAALPTELAASLLDHTTSTAEDLPELPDYLLESTQLGRGAAGSVWLGRPKIPGAGPPRVAIKLLHGSVADDPEFRARFEREGEIMMRLRHPGVVRVLDYESEPSPHIVMELIEGPDLATLRLVREFGTEMIAEIARALLSSLGHAHSRGVVHRDVKPSNILIDNDDNPILVDWGIASAAVFRDVHLTRSYDAIGTPRFSAPEQLERGRIEATPQADIYSVGRVIEFLATGDTGRLGDVAPGLLPGLEAIVRRATHTDPGMRFRHAGEMDEAIRERQQTGWNEGAPLLAGDRLGSSYDLTEAKGEPIEGCFAFGAIEVETARQVIVLLARRGTEAATTLADAAKRVNRAPVTLRFGSLLCCVEADELSDGVAAHFVQRNLEKAAARLEATGTQASATEQLALLGSAASSKGTLARSLLSMGGGLVGPLVGTAIGGALAYGAYKAFTSTPAPLAAYLLASKPRLAKKRDILGGLEAIRRALLVMTAQATTLSRGSVPSVLDWRELCSDNLGAAGKVLVRELMAIPEENRPSKHFDGLSRALEGVSELRNHLAHGVVEKRDEVWAASKLDELKGLFDYLPRLSAKLEARVKVADLAPIVTYDDETIQVLVPVGPRYYYLALNEADSKLPATLPGL